MSAPGTNVWTGCCSQVSMHWIADAAGGDWPDRARVTAVTLVTDAKRGTPSLGIGLLSDLRELFGDHEVMTTESILTALHDIVEAPWGDLRGKPLNDRGLATRLRRYDVVPKLVRDVVVSSPEDTPEKAFMMRGNAICHQHQTQKHQKQPSRMSRAL